MPKFVAETLGRVCDKVNGVIRSGPFGSQLHQSDYTDDQHGTPVVMPKDLLDGRISVATIARVDHEHVDRLSHHKLVEGDIVYSRRGDLGRRALIGRHEAGWLCGTGCMRISLGSSIVRPMYLFYYLGAPASVAWIKTQATGATMPNLNTAIVRSIRIAYPALPTQRKIAAVLSAYDDLIENNRRRIGILEAMAQALYREWFVHFRYPGHEKTRLVDSPLGRIPEGWEVHCVAEVLAHYIGGGWGNDHQDDKHVLPANVIRGTDFSSVRYLDVSGCPYRFHTASNLKPRRLETGDIIMEVSGGGKEQAVGRSMLVTEDLLRAFEGDVICASFCKRLTPDSKRVTPLILARHLHEFYRNGRVEQFQVQSTGIKNLRFSVFLTKELIAVPPLRTQNHYMSVAYPMIQALDNLGARQVTLRRTRDLLLPKLISGEVDVSALDIATAEVA